jgi:hypothetical protein
VLQIICPINVELLQNSVIAYTLLLQQNGVTIDTIVGSTIIKTAGIAVTTISYDFKRYYFQLIDVNSAPAVGVALNVSSAKTVLNSTTGYFYFDTAVTGAVKLTAALSANTMALMYNVTQNLTTF